MQLYLSATAPSPRRVRLYLAEKAIEVSTVDLDLSTGEHLRGEYHQINPHGVVPTLVLDDGTVIGESLAICRYFEAVHPEPALFGRDAREQGLVEMWLRRVEHRGYVCVQDAYRNSRRGFVGRGLPGSTGDISQIPELVERSNVVFAKSLAEWDAHLAGASETPAQWFVGAFSMVDIMALTTLDFALRTKLDACADLSPYPAVRRWHADASARVDPSGNSG